MATSSSAPFTHITNPFLRGYLYSRISFLYFVTRHCKIQDRKTKQEIPFRLWPGQARVAPLFNTEKRIIALKARQIGITWLTAAYVLWRAIFNKNELIIIISAKEDLATEFLDRVKYMFDRLPPHYKPAVFKRTNAELSFGSEQRDKYGNIFLTGLASVIKSLPSTPDAGQSKTISLLVLDESALNRYNKEIWSAATPTLEHSDGQAIVISNPTKIAVGWPWTRELYKKTMRGENNFKRIFLDPFVVPTRGPDFIERVKRDENLTEDDRIMQYPLNEQEAIMSLAGTYFGDSIQKFEAVKGVKGNLIEVNRKLFFREDRRGIIEIWAWPKKDWLNRYAIGSDVGEGTGGSYSVAYVYDRIEEVYVARMRSNRIAADIWGQHLIYLAIYFGGLTTMLGPEKMGPGISTVQYLQRKHWPKLYMRRRAGRVSGTWTSEVGWYMTDEMKRLAANRLHMYFRDVWSVMPCQLLLDECATFIEYEGGKGLGAEPGANDDCVDAAMITLQVSLQMPAPETVQEKHEKGWREMLWGDADSSWTPYDIASM